MYAAVRLSRTRSRAHLYSPDTDEIHGLARFPGPDHVLARRDLDRLQPASHVLQACQLHVVENWKLAQQDKGAVRTAGADAAQ